ncbi:hypothetical protein DPMN_089211 [Dreissena polymorpha]|uniref:CCAAT/enhancer-binding protein zeta n=1 Tax=Dreissena polymorpha TaxID=45954 RepID=A0A9D4KWI2_DREPO|nr:hypothetical protein DPMN_089211 [Dreissena polymorpha]
MAANKKKENKTRVKSSSLKLEGIKELGGTEEDVTLLQDVADSGSGSEAESVADDVSDDDSIQQDEIQNFLKQLDIEKHRPKVKGSKKAEHTEAANEDQEPSTSSNKVDKKEKNKYKVQHSEVSSSVKDPGVEYRAHVRAYQSRKYLLVKPGEYFDTTQASEGDGNLPGLPSDLTRQMEEFAAKLLSDEIDVYNKQRENAKRSDVQWMRTVLTSGTLADKVAALTVLLQESPLHNVTYIDTLLNMARKKNRRENLQAVDTLKELFLTDIMPSNRKLKAFAQHDLTSLGSAAGWNRDVMDKRLLLWQYEAQLKLKYTEFVNILKTLAHDVLLPTKQKAVSTIFNMLVEKPEQEKLLLTTLINKVGDPHYKLAATVSHLLTKLVETHPNMKTIVVREVEQLIFRPNVAERAQYYSVCFLNQLRLSPSHRQLAAKLISIYFAFFKGFVKKGEVDSKMMSALLSGVNRAYPYAKLEEKVLSEQLEHLYKIVHIVNFNTSLQALMLLYQVMGTSESISERYYNALYRKLVDPALATSSKQAAFLNLVFKSIKMDESERRVKAFAKRLLQVCRYQQPPFTCGALVLLSEVLKVKPGVLTLTHTEEDSDDEEHFVDQPAPDDPDHTIKPDSDSDQASSDVEQTEAKHKPSTWVHKKNLNRRRISPRRIFLIHGPPGLVMGPCIVEIGRIVIREVQYQLEVNRCKNREVIVRGYFRRVWPMWAARPRIDHIVIRKVKYQLEVNRCRNEEIIVKGNFGWVWSMCAGHPRIDRIVIRDTSCRNEEIIVKGNFWWVWSMWAGRFRVGNGAMRLTILSVLREVQNQFEVSRSRNEEIIVKGNFGWVWSMLAGRPRIDRIVIREVQYQVNRCRNEEVNEIVARTDKQTDRQMAEITTISPSF